MRPTVGLGFKADYFEPALACSAAGLWFEVHAENYMVAGGARIAMLSAIRASRPLSLHGVGLSLGGAAQPDAGHLQRLRALVDRFEPFVVSEHLAWSRYQDTCFPDLLPFPRSHEALERISTNIAMTQDALGRQILVENPSLYIQLNGHEYDETEFLAELVCRTGCGLLVDVNNVYISANNMGYDARAYLDALPHHAIGEIHLAGHTLDPEHGEALLIDSHDAPIADPVWALFRYLVKHIGERPTLIERDGNLPPFDELIAERNHAAAIFEKLKERVDA